MVDAYFMANGMSPVTGYAADGVTPIINEASGYKEDGTSSSDYKSADGTLYAPAGTRNMYVNREPRFYADITFSNSKWFSGTEGDYTVDFTYSGNCGKAQGNNDFTSTGYLHDLDLHMLMLRYNQSKYSSSGATHKPSFDYGHPNPYSYAPDSL